MRNKRIKYRNMDSVAHRYPGAVPVGAKWLLRMLMVVARMSRGCILSHIIKALTCQSLYSMRDRPICQWRSTGRTWHRG